MGKMVLRRIQSLKPVPWHTFAAVGPVTKSWDILRRSRKLFWNAGESCPLRMSDNMPQKHPNDWRIPVIYNFSGCIY